MRFSELWLACWIFAPPPPPLSGKKRQRLLELKQNEVMTEVLKFRAPAAAKPPHSERSLEPFAQLDCYESSIENLHAFAESSTDAL